MLEWRPDWNQGAVKRRVPAQRMPAPVETDPGNDRMTLEDRLIDGRRRDATAGPEQMRPGLQRDLAHDRVIRPVPGHLDLATVRISNKICVRVAPMKAGRILDRLAPIDAHGAEDVVLRRPNPTIGEGHLQCGRLAVEAMDLPVQRDGEDAIRAGRLRAHGAGEEPAQCEAEDRDRAEYRCSSAENGARRRHVVPSWWYYGPAARGLADILAAPFRGWSSAEYSAQSHQNEIWAPSR